VYGDGFRNHINCTTSSYTYAVHVNYNSQPIPLAIIKQQYSFCNRFNERGRPTIGTTHEKLSMYELRPPILWYPLNFVLF